MKTVEELMQPRLIVMPEHPYPNSPFSNGEILMQKQDGSELIFTQTHDVKKYGPHAWIYADDAVLYPHIFHPLAWYEHRAIEDMPEYVFDNTSIPKSVKRVREWEIAYGVIWPRFDGGLEITTSYAGLLPATKQEYESFITKTTAK